MLDWLKRLGGRRPFENRVGLSEKSLELLAEDFAILDQQLAPGTSMRIMRYLVDGDGEDVLSELAKSEFAAAMLRLRCTNSSSGLDGITPRSEFFKQLESDSVAFFHRLGHLYETCARQLPRHQFRAFGDPKLDWLEILLLEALQLTVNTWPRRWRACPAMTADLVEALIASEGLPRELLVRTAFVPTLQRYGGAELEPIFVSLHGLGQSAVRHRQVLVSALEEANFKQRIYALAMMKKCQVPPGVFVEVLVELALDSSKQVRELAGNMLADTKMEARPAVERKIIDGTSDEKALAVGLLWAWEGEAVRAFFQDRLAEEKSEKVRRAIEDVLTVAVPSSAPAETAQLALPPLPPMPSQVPLGPETEQAWQACFQKVNAAIVRSSASGTAQRYGQPMKQVAADVTRKAFTALQTGERNEAFLKDLLQVLWQRELSDPIRDFWQRPELTLVHLVRFLIQVGALQWSREHDRSILSYGYWLETLLPLFKRTHPEVGLRELGAAFTATGLDSRRIGQGLLRSFQEHPLPLGLPSGQIWPYWVENLDLLEPAFAPSTGDFMARYDQRLARRNAFHALATFPHPPERLVPFLWKLAVGSKSERPAAQRCLEALPDKFERLVASLSAGDAEARLAAAEWLGRLSDARAIEVLMPALKKEKNETVKGAMMSALELLGASVDQFLDRKALLKEAEKGVAKGLPQDLKWFPFERLPVVHWADNGEVVSPAILNWWLIQGFKLKNPAPGPLLRRYCSSLKASEREELGQCVLETWLGEDTSPIIRCHLRQFVADHPGDRRNHGRSDQVFLELRTAARGGTNTSGTRAITSLQWHEIRRLGAFRGNHPLSARDPGHAGQPAVGQMHSGAGTFR